MKKTNKSNENILKEFINHLFPKVVIQDNLKITYTFCLGGLAFVCFLVLILTGIMLIFYYKPYPEEAYNSIVILNSSVFGGNFIRSIHKISSDAFIIFIFLHTLRVIFTGAFRKPRHLNWLIGVLLLYLTILESFLGYILPMEAKGFWAVHTGLNLIKILPFGNKLVSLLCPDNLTGSYTLLRFYALHIMVIPLILIFLVFLHFYLIRKQKGVLPYL